MIIEEIDGAVYEDIILTEEECQQLQQGTLLESMAIVKSRRYYLGVCVGDKWRYTEPQGFLDEQKLE